MVPGRESALTLSVGVCQPRAPFSRGVPVGSKVRLVDLFFSRFSLTFFSYFFYFYIYLGVILAKCPAVPVAI